MVVSEYDCQTCGACCNSPWTGAGYVTLCDIDLERLRPTGLPVVHQIQGYGDPPEVIAKLGTKFDALGRRVCMALDGRAGRNCSCSVYDRRPDACRRFEVGGELCRTARRRLGLPSEPAGAI